MVTAVMKPDQASIFAWHDTARELQYLMMTVTIPNDESNNS